MCSHFINKVPICLLSICNRLRKNKLSIKKLTKLKDTFVHSNKIYCRLFNIEPKCLKLKFDDLHHTNKKSSSDMGYKKLYTFFIMRIKYMV